MTKHKDDVPYRERSGRELNEAASASLRKDATRKGEVDYTVDCPSCFGSVTATEYPGGTYRTVTAVDVGADPGIVIQHPPTPKPVAVVGMECGCGVRHAGAPRGVTGCGSLWVVPA